MASLPDGALYAGQSTLDAKAKNLTVVVQNTGYRPVQQ
jgi:urease beta subunit